MWQPLLHTWISQHKNYCRCHEFSESSLLIFWCSHSITLLLSFSSIVNRSSFARFLFVSGYSMWLSNFPTSLSLNYWNIESFAVYVVSWATCLLSGFWIYYIIKPQAFSVKWPLVLQEWLASCFLSYWYKRIHAALKNTLYLLKEGCFSW